MTLLFSKFKHGSVSTTATLGGRVFTDSDGDNSEQLGHNFEQGIAGVTLNLLQNGVVVA